MAFHRDRLEPGVSDRVPGSQRLKTTPVRIEVSRAGDMAWEYSNVSVGFDVKDGTKVQFDASLLRVWRKGADGQWAIAAQFQHPHDD